MINWLHKHNTTQHSALLWTAEITVVLSRSNSGEILQEGEN
jgi:hypothetical protein